MDRLTATELLALLRDDEGDADEQLLDAAADALAAPSVPTRDQRDRRAAGELVTVAFAPAEREAILAVIAEDTDPPAALLRKAATRLTDALAAH